MNGVNEFIVVFWSKGRRISIIFVHWIRTWMFTINSITSLSRNFLSQFILLSVKKQISMFLETINYLHCVPKNTKRKKTMTPFTYQFFSPLMVSFNCWILSPYFPHGQWLDSDIFLISMYVYDIIICNMWDMFFCLFMHDTYHCCVVKCNLIA